jgi:hypothetical protein
MRSLKMKLLGTFIGVLALCLTFFSVQAAYAAPAHTATSPQAASPAVVNVNCAKPASAIVLTFKDKKNVKYCFSGTGYLGYRVGSVSTFTSTAKFWVRIYLDNGTAGCFLNVASGARPNAKYFDGKHTITQIAVNAVHTAPVCP